MYQDKHLLIHWRETMDNGEIMHDVDATIDKLIENAKALEAIENDPLFAQEKTYLENTQESLLAHLVAIETHLHGPKHRVITSKIKKVSKKRSRKAARTRAARTVSLL